ncbi:DnaD domain protein [Faecalimonas sp.]
MKALKLHNHLQMNSTCIENDFIDNYMARANGEYVKVYLLLLRHLQNPYTTVTISTIADCLENTEKDILRALKYWEKEGLISLTYNSNNEIDSINIGGMPTELKNESTVEELPSITKSTPIAIPEKLTEEKSSTKNSNIEQFKNRKELKSLLFIAEQYLGKTLSATDIEAITYFYDNLHFSAELVEYLIEYCVENGHKSIHYIQKVALAWSEENITTVEEARNSSKFYNKNCYSILNAFGIKGRSAAAPELAYIKKWTEEYGFTLDLIIEACNRTMAKLHQPSFEYTDSILKKWITSNVHHLADLQRLDSAHRQTVIHRRAETRPVVKNKFNNFEGRTYDYDSLEKQLLNQ